MLTNLLLVALGGGLGAAGRWLLSLAPFPAGFPLATLLTNFLGAAAIGAIAALAERSALPAPAVLFLKTGVCGGFTTFSTFSLETVGLLESGQWLKGGGYVLASVALCLAGVVLGRTLVRFLAPS